MQLCHKLVITHAQLSNTDRNLKKQQGLVDYETLFIAKSVVGAVNVLSHHEL